MAQKAASIKNAGTKRKESPFQSTESVTEPDSTEREPEFSGNVSLWGDGFKSSKNPLGLVHALFAVVLLIYCLLVGLGFLLEIARGSNNAFEILQDGFMPVLAMAVVTFKSATPDSKNGV